MEAKQLTDKVVKAAKPKETRYLIRATNNNYGGLHLRVEPSGRKSFYVVLKFDGRTRWKKLGDYPDMNLEAAKDG